MSTTRSTTSKRGAVKGTVAAAAGLAVLLGGAGTFALWNQSKAIGTTGTTTGQLTAQFGTATWMDNTPGGTAHSVGAINGFRLVPGDVLEGTVPIEVTAEGENIVVEPQITYGDTFKLPDGVDATVKLLDGTNPVTQIKNIGSTPKTLSAVVDITFAADAKDSMTEPVDLSKINVSLQQIDPANQPEA